MNLNTAWAAPDPELVLSLPRRPCWQIHHDLKTSVKLGQVRNRANEPPQLGYQTSTMQAMPWKSWCWECPHSHRWWVSPNSPCFKAASPSLAARTNKHFCYISVHVTKIYIYIVWTTLFHDFKEQFLRYPFQFYGEDSLKCSLTVKGVSTRVLLRNQFFKMYFCDSASVLASFPWFFFLLEIEES